MEWRSDEATVFVVFVPMAGGCELVAPITRGLVIPLGPHFGRTLG